MKIWLDDERPMPAGFDIHIKNASDLISLIEADKGDKIEKISLDHDLGEGRLTGYDVAKAIEKMYASHEMVNWISFRVHTANPVGRKNIVAALKSAFDYWCQHQQTLPE